jgi:hypothetical protein
MMKMKNRVFFMFPDMFQSLKKKFMLAFFNISTQKHHFTTTLTLDEKRKNQIATDYSDIFGSLGEQDLFWIFQEILKSNDGINIIEIGPGEGQITCILGEACLGTKKKVYTIWPYDSSYDKGIQTAVQVWHQNIIRKALVPYVTPVLWEGKEGIPQLPDKIHVVFLGNEIVDSERWNSIQKAIYGRLVPGSLIISMKNNENIRSLCMDSKMYHHGELQYCWLTNQVV